MYTVQKKCGKGITVGNVHFTKEMWWRNYAMYYVHCTKEIWWRNQAMYTVQKKCGGGTRHCKLYKRNVVEESFKFRFKFSSFKS